MKMVLNGKHFIDVEEVASAQIVGIEDDKHIWVVLKSGKDFSFSGKDDADTANIFAHLFPQSRVAWF